MAVREEILFEERWANGLRTVLLVGGMLLLMGLLGWFLAGMTGLVLLTGLFLFSLSVAGRVSPRLVLRMAGARQLGPYEHAGVHRITRWLAQRAGLARVPAIYLLPSPALNALTTGADSDAAIGLTPGILSRFPEDELAGIVAHEIAHIKNRDTRLMALAMIAGRFTGALSKIGLLLLVINMPLVLVGQVYIPWPLVVLLLFAPALSTILTFGLSRTREFEADLEAVRLTGDPRGLARALRRLEVTRRPWWGRWLFPGRREEPRSGWLRTHPPTEERIGRLLVMERPEGGLVPLRRSHRAPSRFVSAVGGRHPLSAGDYYRAFEF